MAILFKFPATFAHHPPYVVNPEKGTCTCPGYISMGQCEHLKQVALFLSRQVRKNLAAELPPWL